MPESLVESVFPADPRDLELITRAKRSEGGAKRSEGGGRDRRNTRLVVLVETTSEVFVSCTINFRAEVYELCR